MSKIESVFRRIFGKCRIDHIGPLYVSWVPDNVWKKKVACQICCFNGGLPYLVIAISPLLIHFYFGWLGSHFPYLKIRGWTTHAE